MNDLKSVKDQLGPLIIIDLRDLELAEVHRQLGQEVRRQVWKILERRIDDLKPEEFVESLHLVRRCQTRLNSLCVSNDLSSPVRQALVEYLICLRSWGEGLDLPGFIHSQSHPIFDDEPITPLDLALFLQDEYSGCQTGMLRLDQGSVLLWHTEEDVESEPRNRFDRLRLVAFNIEEDGKKVEIYSFIYPDLLPGSTFNWRSDGYVQAVDALYLRTTAESGVLLANIATWVCLRLGGQVLPQEVISSLGPYVDGYAVLWLGNGLSRMQAGRVEFAGEHNLETRLGEVVGSCILQTNLFSPQARILAQAYEKPSLPYAEEMQQRLQRAALSTANLPHDSDAAQAVIELLCTREGDEFAFANRDVKATLLAECSAQELVISVGSGPAVPGEYRSTFSYSF